MSPSRRPGVVVVIVIIVVVILLIFGSMIPFLLLGQSLGGVINKATGGSGGGSGICANIPEPYATIFRNAGAKFNVQPAFVGAIFVGEHRSVKDGDYKTWPDPNGPWATSPKGANGPFQFIMTTWQGHQQDGDGDGKKDVQNLTDAAFGAAHLLSQNGAGNNTTEEVKLRDSASRYNSGKAWDQGQNITETNNYVNNLVLPAFKAFYCPGSSTITSIEGTYDPVQGGSNGVPLYRQGDPRYSQNQVGGKDFSIWGCCPTSAAMVMRYHGAPVDPIIVAKLTVEGGFYNGSGGTAHGLPWLKKIGEPYGLQGQVINVSGGKNWEQVIQLLNEKKPLIARGDGSKPFSKNGHCIVLTGYDKSTNMISVNNPSQGLGDGPFPLEHMKKYTTVVYYLGK